MKTNTFKLLLLLGFYLDGYLVAAARAETIKIAAIDWCPQLCQDRDRPGYVTEIVEMVFADSGYNLEMAIYPWTRAIFMVRSGRAHALLSPTKNEAPHLRYPEHAVGVQRMCFFSLADSNWRFSDIASLQGVSVGIAQDTSTPELEAFMKDNAEWFQVMPYDHGFVEKNLKQISAGRMDTFLSTYNTVTHTIRLMESEGVYRSSGCLTEENIYMAFSPEETRQRQITKMMTYFDQRMDQLKRSDRLKAVLDRYKLNERK